MNRRDALQRVAVLMGSAVSAPALISILEGCKSADEVVDFALNTDQQALLAELVEVIIPTTDTPGAKEAGVGPFIEVMIKDCYSKAQANAFSSGLEMVSQKAQELGGNFVDLDEAQKIEVVKAMETLAKEEALKAKEAVIDTETGLAKDEAEGTEPTEPFFNILKSLTLFGYFTSEIGATQALDYVPIPGRYDGCIPLKEGQKAYAL